MYKIIEKIKKDKRGFTIIEGMMGLVAAVLLTWGVFSVFNIQIIGTEADKGTAYNVTGKFDQMVDKIKIE